MNVQRIEDGFLVEVESEAETERFARALAGLIVPNTVVALVGTLGAGKTRFVRAVAEALGVDPGAVASPTFVLIHEYVGRLPVYHFDTYRLTSAEAFEDLGVADYWEAGGVCLVEWADRVVDLLPLERWTIEIEATGPTSRRFLVRVPESLRARLEPAISSMTP